MSARRRVVWVESLGLWDLPRLLREKLGGAEIRYDEHQASPRSASAARHLGFLPAGLTLHVQDEKGRALNYLAESERARYLESFCSRTLAGRPAPFVDAVKCYLTGVLFYRIRFLVMVEHAMKGMAGADHAVYLRRHPANDALFAAGRRPPFELLQSASWTGAARLAAGPVYLAARALLTRFGRRPASSMESSRPAVWVEYYPGECDSPTSRAFWREHAVSKDWDRVFYIDRSDTTADRKTREYILSKGFHWIDAHDPAAMGSPALGDLARVLKRFLSYDRLRPCWLDLFELEFDLLTEIWTSVFQRHRVKLLIQHQDFSWKVMAQAQALERADALMLGFNWSYVPYSELPGHITPQQIFFVWGRANRDWLLAKGHGGGAILPCGVWMTPGGRKDLTRAFSPAVRFRFAVFDSSYGYNIYAGAEQLAEFLEALLSELEVHTDWGAVFKPKSERSFENLPGGAALDARLATLRAAGRAVIEPPDTSPADAAAGCDLSVCFGINSAGMVAGAFGLKAIHWDAAGFVDHPFYSDTEQKLLFPRLSDLCRALGQAADGDASIGDFERYRLWMNHFGDTRAAERVGRFISTYMARVSDGSSAPQALDFAVGEYARDNGLARDGRRVDWTDPEAL